jgi:hypothetical protein
MSIILLLRSEIEPLKPEGTTSLTATSRMDILRRRGVRKTVASRKEASVSGFLGISRFDAGKEEDQ